MKFMKYISPKVIGINGSVSPCECTESIVCAYWVQANLILGKQKFEDNDDRVKAFIGHVRKNGVRLSARRMGIEEKSLRRWIKRGNIPAELIEDGTI